MQKQRIVSNMKQKKRLLDDTERKLAIVEHELQRVSEEKNSLREQLERVTESRDSLKNKIRNQQEIVKDTRNGMLELKQRLQKAEQMRALENELLDNFRKLAIHTG
jgi:predicted  nucleic acid-binding Zn-ribbon protein